jgi:energy-coupling factor transporter ATP-binding protein EcfA2
MQPLDPLFVTCLSVFLSGLFGFLGNKLAERFGHRLPNWLLGWLALAMGLMLTWVTLIGNAANDQPSASDATSAAQQLSILASIALVSLFATLIVRSLLWTKQHRGQTGIATPLAPEDWRRELLPVLAQKVKERLVENGLIDHQGNQRIIPSDKELKPEQVQPIAALPAENEAASMPNSGFGMQLRGRMQLVIGNVKQRLSNQEQNLQQILNRDDVKGRLLVLGKPGSGKTTRLLQLAQALITEAQTNPVPIPIILELSAWRNDNQSIAAWIVAYLHSQYGIPKKVAWTWLETKQIMPLFDGLDELGDRQTQGIAAINAFLESEYSPDRLVVCCRWDEYQGEIKLRLQNSVYLNPLNPNQIRGYLQRIGQLKLLQDWRSGVIPRDLAQSPLVLRTMAEAYPAISLSAEQAFASEDDRRKYYLKKIFDAYIQHHLDADRGETYQLSQIKKWLTWLAKTLKTREFLIENMHPGWLPSPQMHWLYWLLFGLTLGVIFGLLSGIHDVLVHKDSVQNQGAFRVFTGNFFGGVSVGVGGGFAGKLLAPFLGRLRENNFFTSRLIGGFVGAVIGSVLALIFMPLGIFNDIPDGLTDGLVLWMTVGLTEKIEPIEAFQLSRIAWKDLRNGFILGIVGGLTATLFLWLAQIIPFLGYIDALWLSMLNFLLGSVTLGLAIGLILGLITGLIFSLRGVKQNKFPNQGIHEALRNTLILTPILCLVITLAAESFKRLGLLSYAAEWLYSSVFNLIIYGVWLGIAIVGCAPIQHYILRFVLWLSGSIPWRYEHFLNDARQKRMLLRVGGQYRFVHDLLQKHFAEL